MGTHHVCRQCGNSYICDQADCKLDFGHECSPDGSTFPHSEQQANIDAAAKALALRQRKQQESDIYQPDLFQKEMF